MAAIIKLSQKIVIIVPQVVSFYHAVANSLIFNLFFCTNLIFHASYYEFLSLNTPYITK